MVGILGQALLGCSPGLVQGNGGPVVHSGRTSGSGRGIRGVLEEGRAFRPGLRGLDLRLAQGLAGLGSGVSEGGAGLRGGSPGFFTISMATFDGSMIRCV